MNLILTVSVAAVLLSSTAIAQTDLFEDPVPLNADGNTFNKILYVEKGGFFPILKHEGWAERHDCLLLTSQGYATRAAKDLIDLLGESDEEILFFCIHDADGYGTKIYEALQEETKARPARKVEIINLGLEPEEALEMGLEVETFKAKKGGVPVATYVPEQWKEWLQSRRVELNAMTTPVRNSLPRCAFLKRRASSGPIRRNATSSKYSRPKR